MAATEFRLGKNHSRTRTAQSLVRGRSDDVRMRHRRRMRAASNQPGEVRHVDEVERADFIGDLAHARKIDDARISAAAADDQLRMFSLRDLFQIVVVDGLGFFGDAVRNDLVRLAGKIQGMPVRQMTAMRQIQAENGVARLQDRGIRFHVGLRSGMRLHVGVFGAEQLLRAVARQVLDNVGELAAAVIAFAGISLGILVREDGARGFEHGFADEVFRGNQFQALVLAAGFIVDGGGDLQDHSQIAGGTSRKFSYCFPKLLVNVRPMQFHISIGRFQRRKSELRVKPVRVAREQDPAA